MLNFYLEEALRKELLSPKKFEINVKYLIGIDKMTDKVLSKVKNKERREKFYLYYSEHIINIKNRLENKNINLGKYNIFLITDHKWRVIMSQSIEDKIINHLIAEYLLVRVFEKNILILCVQHV